ncbi:hypothetical protein [Nonomuraea zeae]|uniref:PNPLA domain-containing protein n=1 Tax=Nonomuraea zeae TaxID=1642303 RepID=A0A5S4FZ16_9ACTN|nr:hypothetical protein [Nonomuraea zeae]TMR25973.1 hypothetical protein ETD85_44110 [Nonomuraea zeae]
MSEHASGYRYLSEPTGLDQIGIALAGGGVRAACLGLGALQVADESGLLGRARYVSAVSGGSYTAAAFMAARAETRRSPLPEGSVPPWSRGSPEEIHLRRNLRYLGEDWSDLFLFCARYGLTLLVNLVPFAAAIVLAGSLLGALYRLAHVLAVEHDVLSSRYAGQRWAAAAAVAVALALAEPRIRSRQAELFARRAALALVVGLGLPDVIALSTRVLDSRMFDMPATIRLAGLLAVAAGITFYLFRSQWGLSFSVPRQLLRRALWLLFSAATSAALLLPLLLVAAQASQASYGATGLAALAAVAVLLVFAMTVHANHTSLHRPYSRRLNRAYIVRTGLGTGPEAGGRALRLSDVRLCDMHAEGLPHLLMCASVNLREDESATGEGCASFVFSPDYVGGVAIGQAARSAPATELDAATMVAASGAAVAPNMGRFTNRATRLALALMNLRLGLWLPNPVPNRSTGRLGARLEARLERWAPRWAVARWHRPGPLTTWREALGNLSVRHRNVFVSDGGHWDNMGVVELLRRRCRTVFAVDASVDEHRAGNLLRVIALARTELGVEFEADGRLLTSREPVERISFRYPDDTQDSPANYLVLMRTHVSQEMPSDLVALAADRAGFPRHSTLNQFLSSRDVDAYVALGRWLLARGLAAADLPPAGPGLRGTWPAPGAPAAREARKNDRGVNV